MPVERRSRNQRISPFFSGDHLLPAPAPEEPPAEAPRPDERPEDPRVRSEELVNPELSEHSPREPADPEGHSFNFEPFDPSAADPEGHSFNFEPFDPNGYAGRVAAGPSPGERTNGGERKPVGAGELASFTSPGDRESEPDGGEGERASLSSPGGPAGGSRRPATARIAARRRQHAPSSGRPRCPM